MSDFQKDNVALMCDIGELVGLFDFETGLDAFLAKAVSTVAWHMRAAVCSI
jgi:Ser/Thr protein kinase RdoA (MazF antagonist)